MVPKFNVIGKNFVLNIAQAENTPGGIFVTNRDPRRQRVKLDAYVGLVEAVGSRCELVRPGMRVVVKRWEYKQHDLDDERIVAQERELLILDDSTPAPGVVVMNLYVEKPKTNLSLPQTYVPKKLQFHVGEVVVANCSFAEEVIEAGDILWVERRERDQFLQGSNRLIFKDSRDSWNGASAMLMIQKKARVLEVV